MNYKVLDFDGKPYHGGNGVWSLPNNGDPGEWMPVIHDIKPCWQGYHVLKREGVVQWLGPELYEVEIREPVIWDVDKGVCAEARLLRKLETWNSYTARLFAMDCAEHVSHLSFYPNCRLATEVARKYEMLDKIIAEAEVTTKAATMIAAWTAKVAACSAKPTPRATADWAVERCWQTDRLFEYLEKGEKWRKTFKRQSNSL